MEKPTLKQRMILLVLADAPAIHDGKNFRLSEGRGAILTGSTAVRLINKGWAKLEAEYLKITPEGLEAVQEYL